MSQSSSFLKDLFPDEPEPDTDSPLPAKEAPATEAPTTSLKIVPATGKALSKAQRTFNRLIKRIETLREKMQNSTEDLNWALAFYADHIAPLQKELSNCRKQYIRLFYPALIKKTRPALSKRQKEALREIIAIHFNSIINLEGEITDKDLIEIFEALDKMAEDEQEPGAEDTDFNEMIANMQKTFSEMEMDVDLSEFNPDMSAEEFWRATEKLRDKVVQELDQSPPPPKRKKTAKQRAAEEKQKAIEEARKRNIGGIYKQLARLLHPDLERDPELRQKKERLMQELTVAYKANDLHTLLRLELEWISKEGDATAQLADEKLDIYNIVLKEQVRSLEMEIDQLIHTPRYEILARFINPFYSKIPPSMMNAKDEMETHVRSSKVEIEQLIADDTLAGIKAILEERKQFLRCNPWFAS